MKLSNRFEQAIIKLYAAYHNGSLNPECCKSCAVGNICDNTDAWKHLTQAHGSGKLSYVGLVNENLGRKFNGYSPMELLQLESVFLNACGYKLPFYGRQKVVKNLSKDVLFNGLCAVMALLCKLDGIPNVMDCSKLFDHDNYRDDNINLVNTLQLFTS